VDATLVTGVTGRSWEEAGRLTGRRHE